MLVIAVPIVKFWALEPAAELRVIVLLGVTVTVRVAVAFVQPPVPTLV